MATKPKLVLGKPAALLLYVLLFMVRRGVSLSGGQKAR